MIWRSEFLAEVTGAGREIYRATLYGDDYLWGEGLGYRNEVARRMQDWCEASERQTLVDSLENRVNKAWNEHIVDRLHKLSEPSSAIDLPLGEQAGTDEQ